MFEIGDKVKNVYVSSKNYGRVGEVVDIDEDNETISVEYESGFVGEGKYSSYKQVCTSGRGIYPSNNNNRNVKSIMTRLADLFRTEPEKTYRKLGIKDSEGNLTSEGKELLLNKLFDANE